MGNKQRRQLIFNFNFVDFFTHKTDNYGGEGVVGGVKEEAQAWKGNNCISACLLFFLAPSSSSSSWCSSSFPFSSLPPRKCFFKVKLPGAGGRAAGRHGGVAAGSLG